MCRPQGLWHRWNFRWHVQFPHLRRSLERSRPQSSSASRFTAGAAGFFILSQVGRAAGTVGRATWKGEAWSPVRLSRSPLAGSEICALLRDARRTSTKRSIFILPHGPPESYEGHEWFVALVVLVGLYFAVRN